MIEFQIRRAVNQQYFCRIVANNRTLFKSEEYHNKQDAVHAANLLKGYAANGKVVDYT